MTGPGPEHPLVSFIVPAYRCARFLPDAIESALGQTWPHIEVVVVNDGSPDETDDVVRPYLQRIVYYKQENRGLSAARNEGFRRSRGDFVCFLDADDIVLPEKIERQLSAFAREADLGVVISGYTFVEEDGRTRICEVRKPWCRDATERLLAHESFAPHAALLRRRVLEASSLFPEKIDTYESQEDWQLWLELALEGVQFGSVVESTCLYRQRGGSIRQDPVRHNDGARRVVRWLRGRRLSPKLGIAVDRLEETVEMERIAALVRMKRDDEAGSLLVSRVRARGEFWKDPAIWLRLFERSLTVWEEAAWQREPEPERFEAVVLRGLIRDAGCEGREECARRATAAAWLALADLRYGKSDGPGARAAMREALRKWPGAAIDPKTGASVLRGTLGPNVAKGLRWLKLRSGRTGQGGVAL